MGSDFSYDPVTAIDEAAATGATAAIFADIRATMDIPLITSIWRGLAGMEDSLPRTWAVARPVYASGLPKLALANAVARTYLPVPEPLAPTQLKCLAIGSDDLQAIRTIIAAYNRSNGMNMVTLAALINPPATDPMPACNVPEKLIWPPYPALPAQEAIDPDVWSMIRHVNAFGAAGPDANVATLWRHLAHWPGLLALIYTGLLPHHRSGAITQATTQMVALARAEGARMAHLRPATFELSEQARKTITGYVSTPTQVVRMVTLGHALAKWLS